MKIISAGDVQRLFPLEARAGQRSHGISRHSVPKKIIVAGNPQTVIEAMACIPGSNSVKADFGVMAIKPAGEGHLSPINITPDWIYAKDTLWRSQVCPKSWTISLDPGLLRSEIKDWLEQTRSGMRLGRAEGLRGCNAVFDAEPEDPGVPGGWRSAKSIEMFIASEAHIPVWQLNINFTDIRRVPTFLKERTEYIISDTTSGFLNTAVRVVETGSHKYRMGGHLQEELVFRASELFEGLVPVDFASPGLLIDPSVMPAEIMAAIGNISGERRKNCIVFDRLPRGREAPFVNWASLSFGYARHHRDQVAAELAFKYVSLDEVRAFMEPDWTFDWDALERAMREYEE